jgi:metal-sulfur cluster biosynthetic enzyme
MNDIPSNVPHWDAEDEHPELCTKLRDVFREVRDPEIGMDLIQLGLVRNVSLVKQKLKIEMILTTPYCPYAPMLMESARRKAETVAEMPAEVAYGKEVWDQSMMEDGTSFDWGLF